MPYKALAYIGRRRTWVVWALTFIVLFAQPGLGHSSVTAGPAVDWIARPDVSQLSTLPAWFALADPLGQIGSARPATGADQHLAPLTGASLLSDRLPDWFAPSATSLFQQSIPTLSKDASVDTATIGQVYTYTLVFTIPSGITLTNVLIEDALPRYSPRIYVHGLQGNYTGPTSRTPGTPLIGPAEVSYCGSGNYDLCWRLPDIENTTGHPYVYEMTYQAQIVQSSFTHRGDVGTNSATLKWDGGTATASTDVTVVAPNIQVKRIAYTADGEWAESSGSDAQLLDLRANEAITVTVLVTNVADSSVAPAYLVDLTDYRPEWIAYDGIIYGPAPDSVSDDQLFWTQVASVLSVGEVFAVSYRAVVAAAVAPGLGDGRSYNTRARYDYLPGGSSATIYAGGLAFRSPDINVVKTVRDEPPDQGIVVMGEIVTYTVAYTLPGGTTVYDPAYLQDRLDDGLRFISASPPPAEVTGFVVDETGESETLLTWAITAPLTLLNDLHHTFVITAQVSPTFFLGTDAGQEVPKAWTMYNDALLRWDFGPWPGNRTRTSESVVVRMRRPQISPEKLKDGPQDQFDAGEKVVRFELRDIRNGDGPDDAYAQVAYDVLVTDTLPQGWTYVSSQPPGNATDSGGQWVVTWDSTPVLPVGSYLPGPSVTPSRYIVTATSPAIVVVGKRFTNTVEVAYSSAQGYRYVDRDELVMQVPLAVSKEITPASPFLVGDVVTYRLVAAVPPRAILYWPHHLDTLPPGVRYTGSFVATGGTLLGGGPSMGSTGSQETLEWWWETLDNTGSDDPFTFTFSFGALLTGVDLYDNLRLTDYRGDSRFTNNSSIEWNTEDAWGFYPVSARADRQDAVIQPYLVDSRALPSKTLLAGGPTVESGDVITYRLTVYNTGKAPAYDVFINDTLPPGLVFRSYQARVYPAQVGSTSYVPTATVAPVTGQQGAIAWIFEELAEGDGNYWDPTTRMEIDYTLEVTDSVGVGAALINSAQLAYYSSQPGEHPNERHYDYLSRIANRYSAEPVHVPEAQITKTASITEVELGGRVVFTLTVPGQPLGATMYNVAVTDTMPITTAGPLHVLSAVASGVTLLNVTSDTVSADYETIASHGQVAVVITAGVPLTATGGLLYNHATVSWDDADSDGVRHQTTSDPVGITILAPDLTVTKDAPAAASPGSALRYTILYENTGTATANQVRLTDTLPVSVTFADMDYDRPITPTAALPGSLVWDVGSLYPGESGTLWVTMTVWSTATLGSQLVNTATIRTPSPGDNLSNNQDTAVTTVGGAVLEMAKTATPDPVAAGDRLLYTVVVTNSGNDASQNLVITDKVPLHTSFIDASLGGSLVNDVVTWTPLAVAAGARTAVTVAVRVELDLISGTLIVNDAYGAVADNALGTSGDPVTVTVYSRPDLSIEKTAPASTNPGDDLVYTVRYRNLGNAMAHDVQVVEAYSPDTSFVAAVPAPDEGNNLWRVGNMAPGSIHTIVITMNVGAAVDRGAVITNTVMIQSEETQAVTDTVSTLVGGQMLYLPLLLRNHAAPVVPTGVNLVVQSIQVSPVSPTAGEATRISVTLHNSGTNTVTDDFWVDLYVDPYTTPTINLLWNDIAPFGKAWIVRDDIPGGSTLVIHTDQPDDQENPDAVYSNWPGWFVSAGEHVLYAQVDAYGMAWGYVFEDNEADNVAGPKTVTVVAGDRLVVPPPPIRWQERR